MSGFFPFLTEAHESEELALAMLERRELVTSTTQGQPENADLHDALKENQTIESKQMEMISESQKKQEKTEETLQASVRFPRDEAFQRNMKNARLYTLLLLKRMEQKKKEKRTITQSVQNVIEWQRQDRENPPKDQWAAFARFYIRTHLLRG